MITNIQDDKTRPICLIVGWVRQFGRGINIVPKSVANNISDGRQLYFAVIIISTAMRNQWYFAYKSGVGLAGPKANLYS